MRPLNTGYVFLLLVAGMVAAISACKSPLDIDTPKVDGYEPVTAPAPIGGDTIFAQLDGEQAAVYASEVGRPIWHNGYYGGGHYVTVEASGYGIDSVDYTAVSMRLDRIIDTGYYQVNSNYNYPTSKFVDTLAPPQIGILYDRKRRGQRNERYESRPGLFGEVHIVTINKEVMTGTFVFDGVNTVRNDTALITGAFRVLLKPQ